MHTPLAEKFRHLYMRVIAGSFRSRKIEAPAGLRTRPTSDRLRETLFNVLARRIEGARFLDLYAGSGAVGIEALSRGASEVCFVERAAPAVNVLRANLASLGITDAFRIVPATAQAFLRKPEKQQPFHLAFLDPPYDAADEYVTVLGLFGGSANGLLADGATVIAEHRRHDKLDDRYGLLRRTRLLQQGDAALSFYATDDGATAAP